MKRGLTVIIYSGLEFSKIICCSCLLSGFVYSGLVRTSQHTGASHWSAQGTLHILHREGRISIQQSANGRAVRDGSL